VYLFDVRTLFEDGFMFVFQVHRSMLFVLWSGCRLRTGVLSKMGKLKLLFPIQKWSHVSLTTVVIKE
jgi:hypothetical protein